ncbi:MAG: carboxypeptidase regulatory-like domain-containing protein [Acidobacteria bacterium]|nr:carboxypeptidase regulatory-like domain-containing protein [Acidobacteriota bacterium]
MISRFTWLLCLLALTLFGQGERGTFNGTIADPSGAVIPGATVKALNLATNVETPVETTSAGVFRMPYLSPGTYRITASAAGFKTSVRDNVVLAVAQTLTVDFTMEVGAVSDQVTVSSDPPLLETGTAEIGSYVSKKEFDTWPITVGDGRRQIQQFIFTSLPGTVGGTFQGSINGGQNYSHEILVDGIPLGRMDLQGGSNNEFSPTAEAISEMKMQTGVTSAQYSGGQTALANFATKSGTNQLHGSAYYYVQNDALRGNSWNNNAGGVKRQPFRQHNYGQSVGGPVLIPKVYNGKNRTFFFENFERTKVRDFQSTAFSTLPMPDFKQGNFARLFDSAFTGNTRSGTTAGTDAAGNPVRFGAIYDPLSMQAAANGTGVRTPFAGNVIPRARFSPVAQKILDVGIDDPLYNTMLNNIPNLGACCPFFDEKMLLLRGDHNFNNSHKMYAMFSRNFRTRNNSPGGRWGIPPGLPTNVYQNQDTPGTMGRLAYDWTIRPNLLNHFAGGYNRFGNINESVYVDQDWAAKVGVTNVPGTHFPRLNFSGQPFQGGGIGAGGQLGSSSAGGSYNGSTILTDDMTYIRGKHNFKFGVDHRRYYQNNRNKSSSGQFNFTPTQTAQPGFLNETGHSFASFLLGAYGSTSRGIAGSNFGQRWRSFGTYFQDDFKVNRKLTLNIGMRWEIIGGLMEVAGRMTALSLTTPNPAAGGRLGALVFADDLGKKTFMDTYWKQFSPKLGFAYAMTDKLVMRGGYGINNTPTVNNFTTPGTFGFNSSINVNSGNTQLAFAEDPLGFIHNPYPSFTGTLPDRRPNAANGQGIEYQAPDSGRLPYVQNWNFGFQYQLPAATVLEVNYIGNKGTRLIAKGFDQMNAITMADVVKYGDILPRPWTPASPIPQPFAGFAGTNLQALRPYPQFTGISQPFPNFGHSSYHSLQIQATRHFKGGFSMLGAYTWSKALGLTDNVIDGETPADQQNRRLERAITNYHYPQFFKATWIYELPIGPGKLFNVSGVAASIIGGWQITGNHQIRSGNPVAIGTGGINNPLGTARPDLVSGVAILTNQTPVINFRGINGGSTYLNRDAFTNPPVFAGGQNVVQRLGTVGPYLPNIRDRHFVNEDLGIFKNFKIKEQAGVELRGTFLNPFNRHGIGGLVTAINNPFFGQFTGQQRGPRNIELALRVTF